MADEFVSKATTKGFDKFAVMAKNAYDVLNSGRFLREDQKVIVLTHSEDVLVDGHPMKKIKTIGKMLDEKVTLEGLFTVLLFTFVLVLTLVLFVVTALVLLLVELVSTRLLES